MVIAIFETEKNITLTDNKLSEFYLLMHYAEILLRNIDVRCQDVVDNFARVTLPRFK